MASSYRVLSIDGGGIRGVLPASVPARLEELCGGQPVAQLFDLIVGTSTGGILALGLTVPGPDGTTPAHKAVELLGLYGTEAEAIFPGGGPPDIKQRIFGPPGGLMASAQRVGSIFGGQDRYAGNARYFVRGLEEVLDHYVGATPLTSALADVIVTSYDIANDEPILFSSRPRSACISDVEMRVVARATSAGPTYFEPQPLVTGQTQRALVDGGVYVNNPAMLAYVYARKAAVDRPIALVSLGTGLRNPATPRSLEQAKTQNWIATVRTVMDAAMTGGGKVADETLEVLLTDPDRYWRIQTTVGPCSFAMDDSSPQNVECLRSRAGELVGANETTLAEITNELLRT